MSFLISASHPTRTCSDANRLWRFNNPTGPILLCRRPHMYILSPWHRHRRIWHDMSALNITRADQLLFEEDMVAMCDIPADVVSRAVWVGWLGGSSIFDISDWRRLQLIICWRTFSVLLFMQWENMRRGVIDGDDKALYNRLLRFPGLHQWCEYFFFSSASNLVPS